MLIGVHGRAGSGKDTISDFLVKEYGFIKLSFAKKIKILASLTFGFKPADFRGDRKENYEIDSVTPRFACQEIGQSFRNIFGPDIWIKSMEADFPKNFIRDNNIVISDVRHENEVAWVKSNSGYVWHIQRDNLPNVNPHISEEVASVIYPETDRVICNNSTTDHLFNVVREFMDSNG